MSVTIRRLGTDDVALLRMLAFEDADFDIDGRGKPKPPLEPEETREYLADPSVLHWVAEEGEQVLGHLHCQIVRKHAGEAKELLLYEIGVRAHARRRGVGQALLGEMFTWMKRHDVDEVWVLADNPGATAFYEACLFEIAPEAPVYLTRRL